MDPTVIVAVTKTIFGFVTSLLGLKKLKKQRDSLKRQLAVARTQFGQARDGARRITDQLFQYQQAARATDDISRAMADLGKDLAVAPAQINFNSVVLRLDNLRHGGPLNDLSKFQNTDALEPTVFKDQLSTAIRSIDMGLTSFPVNQADLDGMRNRVGALLRLCDNVHRTRNQVVNDFGTALGNALR